MWEDSPPTDDAVRQGDLIDLAGCGTAFPRLRLPIEPTTVAGQLTKTAVIDIEAVSLGVITSQCCTMENPVDHVGHVVVIAPVARLGWRPEHATARLESLSHATEPMSSNRDTHHFMLEAAPEFQLRDPGDNACWVVSLVRAVPFLGNHSLLLPHRVARMTARSRGHLRETLMTLTGRPTDEDARLLSGQ